MSVTPSTGAGGEVRALLYTGSPQNPAFDDAIARASVSAAGTDARDAVLRDAASTVSSAVGPSGPNIDYFDNLAGWLRAQGLVDPHVAELEALMASDAGP